MALPSNPLESFIWGAGGSRLTPEQIARQREIAGALLQQGVDFSPVASPLQGLGRVVNAAAGAYRNSKADQAENANASASQNNIASLLAGGMNGFPAAPAPSGAPTSMAAMPGSLPSVDVSKSASGGVDPQMIFAGLKKRGLNDAQAYATLGNWKQESEFRPGAINPGEGAVGFTQWREGRKSSLESYARATGRNASDPEAQMDFYVREAGIVPDETGAVVVDPGGSAFAKATDIQGANRALKGFIRYGSPYDKGGEGTRLANALAYQKRFGSASPAVAAVNSEAGQPQQVASLDPSIGMPSAQSGSVALPDQAPIPLANPDAVGAPGATTPAGQRVLSALMNPEPMGGSPMPMQGGNGLPPTAAPGTIARGADGQTYQYAETTGMAGASGSSGWIPVNTGSVPPQLQQPVSDPQQQVAQNLPVMAGGSSDAIPAGQAQRGINPAIVQALSSPYASDGERKIAGLLLNQQMQEQDPLRQLQIQAAQKSLAIPPKQWQKLDDNTLFDPASGETKSIDGGGPSKFAGTGLEAQAWNILQSADPSSREYATAYSIVSQPKTQLVQTENGMMPVEVPPQLPGWLTPPGGGQASAPGAAPQSVPQASPGAAPAAAPGVPQNVIPGTKKPATESESRNGAIGHILLNEVPTLGANFSALSDPKGQFLSLFGAAGNPWQSEEYQRAAGAVKSSVTNVLYSLSGASSNPGEVLNQIDILTPKYGDKPGVLADKLNRFKTYVRSIASEANDPELKKSVDDALKQMDISSPDGGTKKKTSTGVEWSVSP